MMTVGLPVEVTPVGIDHHLRGQSLAGSPVINPESRQGRSADRGSL
jgi:hypothetical protein